MPLTTTFFPTQLKLKDYPTATTSTGRDSPSPSKKRRVQPRVPPPPPGDDLLTSRLNSTLKLRDVWSDIARRHSVKPVNTSTSSRTNGGGHRPTGKTRALPVEQDDIIDLKSLRIVQDRGVLRNSRKGSFAIGGYLQSEVTVGRDTGTSFRIINDDDDDDDEDDDEEEGEWQDEDEEGNVSWEEPEIGATDSEDELAEFDDLQSLPSLKYREEKRKADERNKELKSFWEEELEWTAGKSAWDNHQDEEGNDDEDDELRIKESSSNQVLEKPVRPPQSREEFRREFLKSCTPRPISSSSSSPSSSTPSTRPPRPRPSHSRLATSTLPLDLTRDAQESDDEMNITPHSIARSASSIPSSSSKLSRRHKTATPTPRSISTKPSSTSTLRRQIETIDLADSPPPQPEQQPRLTSTSPSTSPVSVASSPSASSSTLEIVKYLSNSPSRFPGDRRSIFARDSAPPPPETFTQSHESFTSSLYNSVKKPLINNSPLRQSISMNISPSPSSISSNPTLNRPSYQIEESEILSYPRPFELPSSTVATTTKTKTKTCDQESSSTTRLPPSPPNSKASNVSSNSNSNRKSLGLSSFTNGSINKSDQEKVRRVTIGSGGGGRNLVFRPFDSQRWVEKVVAEMDLEKGEEEEEKDSMEPVVVDSTSRNTDKEKEKEKEQVRRQVQQRPTPEATPPPSTSKKETSINKRKQDELLSSRSNDITESTEDVFGKVVISPANVVVVVEKARRTKPRLPSSPPTPTCKATRSSPKTTSPSRPSPPSSASSSSLSSRTRSTSVFEGVVIPAPRSRLRTVTPLQPIRDPASAPTTKTTFSETRDRDVMNLGEDDEDELDCLPPSPLKKRTNESINPNREEMEIDNQGKREEMIVNRSYGLSTPPVSKGKPSTPSKSTPIVDKPSPPTSLEVAPVDVFKIPALPSSSSAKKKRSTLPSSNPNSLTPARSFSTIPKSSKSSSSSKLSTPNTSSSSSSARRPRISSSSTPTPQKSPNSSRSLAQHILSRSAPSVPPPSSSSSPPLDVRSSRSQYVRKMMELDENGYQEEEEEEDELARSTPVPSPVRREESVGKMERNRRRASSITNQSSKEKVRVDTSGSDDEGYSSETRRKDGRRRLSSVRRTSAISSTTRRRRTSPRLSVTPSPVSNSNSNREKRSGTVILDQAPVIVDGDDEDELMMMG